MLKPSTTRHSTAREARHRDFHDPRTCASLPGFVRPAESPCLEERKPLPAHDIIGLAGR